MILSIRLFDKTTNSLASASLRIIYRHPPAPAWNSGVLPADANGILSFEMADNIFAMVDFAAAVYNVSYNGKGYPARVATAPTLANPRLDLHVDQLAIGTVPSGPAPAPGPNAPVTVRLIVSAEDGKALKNTQLRLSWVFDGKNGSLELGKTDANGTLDHATTLAQFAIVTKVQPTLVNAATGQAYDVINPKMEQISANIMGLTWIVVPRAGPPDVDIDKPKPSSQIKIVGALLEENIPLARQRFGLRWQRPDGMLRDIELAKTDKEGIFQWLGAAQEVAESVFFKARLYDRDTNVVYEILSSDEQERTDKLLRFTWHLARTNDAISKLPDFGDGAQGLVSGHIHARGGQPQAKLIVRAYDIDLPDEQLLGEAETDDSGFYAINYAAGTAAQRQKDALDIVVRSYPPGNPDAESLAESYLHLAASPKLIVDLVTGDQVWLGASLYDRIFDVAIPTLNGASIRIVKPAHIMLLAGRTPFTPVELGRFAAAWFMALDAGAKETDREAAAPFFGWLTDGLPSHLVGMALQPIEKLEASLRRAVDANWIAKADYTWALDAAEVSRTKVIAQHQPELVAYLKAGKLTDDQTKTVIGVFLEGLDAEEREAAIEQRLGEAKGSRALDLIEIWQALNGNTALGTAILTEGGVNVPRDLVELSPDNLAKIAQVANAVPEHAVGAAPQLRAQAYAETLTKAFETRYPLAYFAHQLSLSDFGQTRRLGNRLKTVLKMQPPRMGGANPIITGGWDQELLDLGSLYYSAAPNRRAPIVDQLIRNAFNKAPDITAPGRTNFRAKMSDKFATVGAAADADMVFTRAQLIVSVANAVKMQAIAEQAPDGKVPATLVGQLFQGSINSACPHCKSMTSPAAYLVDLVRYTQRAAASPSETGWDMVDRRRPDLKNIHLSCANSDTPMPYIDLVLELLEDQLAPWRNDPRQTTANEEELAAAPQHVNAAAYRAIQARAFPWSAAYHRQFDLTQKALAQSGTPLADLLDALNHPQADAARLGLWDNALFVLETTANKIAAALGETSIARLKQNTTLSTLASHLLIDTDVLLKILDTKFVNPDAAALVTGKGDLLWEAASNPMLARAALLGRMLAHSGIKLEILEHWLRIVDPSNADWQANMAACLRISDRLRLSPAEVEALLTLQPDGRRTALAALADTSVDMIGLFESTLPVDTGSALGIDRLFAHLAALTGGGKRDPEILVGLIDRPRAGGPFDPAIAEAASQTLFKSYELEFDGNVGPASAEELALIAETLAPSISADAGLLTYLLPQSGVIDALRVGRLPMNEVHALWRQAAAASEFDLESEDFAAIASLSQRFGTLDIASLPATDVQPAAMSSLLVFAALVDLNATQYRGEANLFVRLAEVTNRVASLKTAFALFDLPEVAIGPLFGTQGLALTSTADLFTGDKISALAVFLRTCRHLRTDAATLLTTVNGYDGDQALSFAEQLAGTNNWPHSARQIMNPVRERSRDALLATLMVESRQGANPYNTTADVYGHFLIDPEMMSVVDTSRIKQAISSLQQFVQRVQLGVEQHVQFSQNDASQWVWRRNYRVWEANRKVFVFPENWIRPELRDNKTSLYKALESELLTDEVRAETAEEALLNYARGLHEVAGLQMVAMRNDAETATTYVVGRTREKPHHYYFNARGSNGLWDGWQKIDLEIEGDHVLPVIYARRLFLAWVPIETKIAVDDPAYAERLSDLEGLKAQYRDEVDSLGRKITDIEGKQEDNNKYLDAAVGGNAAAQIYQVVYEALDTTYTHLLVDLRSKLDVARVNEKTQITEINSLKARYTYCEVSLCLSQRKRSGGWEPIKRSGSMIRTKLENDGILSGLSQGDKSIFFDDSENFYLRAAIADGDLTFTLCRGYENQDNDKRGEQIFGWFRLDIVNNVLTATEKVSLNNSFETAIIRSGLTARQGFMLKPDETTLTVLDGGEGRLLGSVSQSAFRAIPHRYEDGTSLLVEQGARTYMVEKAAVAQKTHLQAERLEDGSTSLPAFLSSSATGRAELVGETDVAEIMSNRIAVPPVVRLTGGDKWQFTAMHHPFSDVIVTELYRYGLDGLYLPDKASRQENAGLLIRQNAREEKFAAIFAPTAQVAKPHPIDSFDFSRISPFGVYNWELFFHAPFAIAEHLRQNRRFEDARRWLHFIFNPTEKDGKSSASVWRFGPFFLEHQRILAGDTPDLMDEAANPDFTAHVEEWEKNPFNPHAIARTRTVAYMRATFMSYVDNLLDWGDDLFRRDTLESVNEAAQLYSLVAEMIGPKPTILPDTEGDRTPMALGEALSWTPSLEHLAAGMGNVQPHPDSQSNDSAFFELFGEFCMPSNDRLVALWQRLEDRLFKIRNSLNIDGAFRKLALYQPPIDPALLVRAAAAGLSLADALSGMSAKRPNYRFTFMLPKALEFAAEVRGLGAALLAALEKRDSEALSQLRATHEVAMSRQIKAVYESRIKEAELALASLDASIVRAISEEVYFDSLITLGDLPEETEELAKMTEAQGFSTGAGAYNAIAALVSAIPQIGVCGVGPHSDFGGQHMGNIYRSFAGVFETIGSEVSFSANMAGRTATRIRRAQEWMRGKERAAQDVKVLQQDRLAAEIRLAIAKSDLDIQIKQIAHAEEADMFLRGKFTGEALYGWMTDRLSALHFQAFKLANDLAKQAETCFREELSMPSAAYIEPGAWESMRKGLLAGDQLLLDLRRMEAGYLAANRRAHELIKNVSLAQVDPVALLSLRQQGNCRFSLPEFLFDLDYPGHVNRRIKSVNLTIPALAGPQTTIGCTLTLVESSISRKNADGLYALELARSGESLATSSGQNDTGMFQFDFNDPRYLKFEGTGVVSTWDLKLPATEIAQFDYGSISDVILQIHYTADDPETVSHVNDVMDGLHGALDALGHRGTTLFSMRYDFPETWARLRNQKDLTEFSIGFDTLRLPQIYNRREIAFDRIDLTSISSRSESVSTQSIELGGVGPMSISLSLTPQMRSALDTSSDIVMILCFTAGGTV